MQIRTGTLALTLLLLASSEAAAEWQLRPFLGLTLGSDTTFVDLAGAAGKPNIVVGASAAILGNIFGIEADLGYAPGFFQSGDEQLVLQNSATTLTGNVIIALPRNKTEYTLGPYFVAGLGLMRAHIEDVLGVLTVGRTMPAMDIGGGVTGNLSERIGLIWEARYFSSIGQREATGLSFGEERLSFWRAHMGLVVRY